MNFWLIRQVTVVSLMMVIGISLHAGSSNRVAVIVNSHLLPKIEDSLKQYEKDLISEGYSVVVQGWSLEKQPDPKELKSFLHGLYKSNEGLGGALFVGDLPIVMFEPTEANNSKKKDYVHQQTFLTDKFYMDLEGDEWLDTDDNGYYDMPAFVNGKRVHLDIWVSRLKASGLRQFAGLKEWDLVNKYFEKNHEYRVGLSEYPEWNLLYIQDDHANERNNFNRSHFYDSLSEKYTIPILRGTAGNEFLHLLNEGSFEYVTWVIHGSPRLLAFDQCDYNELPKWNDSNSTTCNGQYGYITSKRLAQTNVSPGGLFSVPCSCWVGKYTEPDYIMGTYLFKPQAQTLSMISATIPIIDYNQKKFLQGMKSGLNFGDSYRKLANEWTPRFVRALLIERSKVLFGDGTLKRQQFMAPRQQNAKKIGDDSWVNSSWVRERITPVARLNVNSIRKTVKWPELKIPGTRYEVYRGSVDDSKISTLVYSGDSLSFRDPAMKIGDHYWLKYAWEDGVSSDYSEFAWRALPRRALAPRGLRVRGAAITILPAEEVVEGGSYQLYRFAMDDRNELVIDREFEVNEADEFIDHEALEAGGEYYYAGAFSVWSHEDQDALVGMTDLELVEYP